MFAIVHIQNPKGCNMKAAPGPNPSESLQNQSGGRECKKLETTRR